MPLSRSAFAHFVPGLALGLLGWGLLISTGGHAWSIPLPPKVSEVRADNVADIRALPQVKAYAVQSVFDTPVWHGLIDFDPAQDMLKILSANGEVLTGLRLNGDRVVATRSQEVKDLSRLGGAFDRPLPSDSKAFWIHARGTFVRGEGQKLDFWGMPPTRRFLKTEPAYWSIEMGLDPVGVLVAPNTRALAAWSLNPARLFYLPSRMTSAVKVTWSADSEIASFWPCDSDTGPRALVVENLKSGLTRFVFMNGDLKPVSQTLFDFSSGKGRSEVTGLVSAGTRASSCEDFFVAGSFGVVRVRYPKGSF